MNKRQLNLLEFVKVKHGDQKRKYTGEPYLHHVVNVALIVKQFIPTDPGAIEIALCHDLFEDTDCDIKQLYKFLVNDYSVGMSTAICMGVKSLTDEFTHEAYPDMNRKERKFKEAHRLSSIDVTCQSIKYADIIDNTKSIVTFDPQFSSIYLPEMVMLLNKLRKGNINLLIECCHVLHEGMQKLKIQPVDG